MLGTMVTEERRWQDGKMKVEGVGVLKKIVARHAHQQHASKGPHTFTMCKSNCLFFVFGFPALNAYSLYSSHILIPCGQRVQEWHVPFLAFVDFFGGLLL